MTVTRKNRHTGSPVKRKIETLIVSPLRVEYCRAAYSDRVSDPRPSHRSAVGIADRLIPDAQSLRIAVSRIEKADPLGTARSQNTLNKSPRLGKNESVRTDLQNWSLLYGPRIFESMRFHDLTRLDCAP